MTVGISFANLEDRVSVVITDTCVSKAGRGSNSYNKQRVIETDGYAAVLMGTGFGDDLSVLFSELNELKGEYKLEDFVSACSEVISERYQKARQQFMQSYERDFQADAKAKYSKGSFAYQQIRDSVEKNHASDLLNDAVDDLNDDSDFVHEIAKEKEKMNIPDDNKEALLKLRDAVIKREALKRTEKAIDILTENRVKANIEDYVIENMNRMRGDFDRIVQEKYNGTLFAIQAYDKASNRIRNFLFDARGYREHGGNDIIVGSGGDLGGAHIESEKIGTAIFEPTLTDIMFDGLCTYAHSTINQGVGGTPMITLLDGNYSPINAFEFDHRICAALTNIATLYQAGELIDRDSAIEYFDSLVTIGKDMLNDEINFRLRYGHSREHYSGVIEASQEYVDNMNSENRKNYDEIMSSVAEDYHALPVKKAEHLKHVNDICTQIGLELGVSSDILMHTTIPYSTWKEYVNVKRLVKSEPQPEKKIRN